MPVFLRRFCIVKLDIDLIININIIFVRIQLIHTIIFLFLGQKMT